MQGSAKRTIGPMRLLASILLLLVSVTLLGCGSGTGTEMPENPDPMPTEQPHMSEGTGEVTVD
jgi:hypothetical protein